MPRCPADDHSPRPGSPTLGRRLAELRLAAGLHTARRARALGVPQPFVARVEVGEKQLPPARRAAWAAVLGVDQAELEAPTMSMTPARRSTRARIGAYAMHAAGRTNTATATAARMDRYAAEVAARGAAPAGKP